MGFLNSNIFKKVIKPLLALVIVFVFVVIMYVSYLFMSYNRIGDNVELSINSKAPFAKAATGKAYTVMTQNLGFGAYTADFTFFMDGGTESRAKSEESVKKCINGSAELVQKYNPDFILFQEVDIGSTRSHQVDQAEILRERFSDYCNIFAINYHSAYLFYPFNKPHGASNSGIMTFSKYNVTSSVRRSLPISDGVSKFLDLDRCYSVSRIPVENGKYLVIYNVHLSAYGADGFIKDLQTKMLLEDMKTEYEAGNYCVCGGDFNIDFTGDSALKLNDTEEVEFAWAQPFDTEALPDGISRCTDYVEHEYIPTCRNCDIPYGEDNFVVIVDGFLVSDNVEVCSVQNINAEFVYSDHNPVVMKFALK